MILIAEDSRTQALQLQLLLEHAGYEVVHALDGEQALALAHEHRPELLITDLMMPRMDGLELCERIKHDAELRATRVILLTSMASPQDILHGLASGADNFVRKPYDGDSLLARVQRVLATAASGEDDGLEVTFADERHVIDAGRRQIFDFLFSTFEEATQLAAQLSRSHSAIVDASADGIVLLSVDGRIETFNPGAEALYGHRADEIVGASLDVLVPAERRDEAARMLARAAAGESVSAHETVRLTRAGDEREVSLTLSPVRDAAGAVVGIAEIARDVTEQKQLERELLHSQKLESVGRLAGGIAHDFNNLMTVVVGFSDLLLARGGDADQDWTRYLTEIKRAGERATALSQQLLAFGRRQLLNPEVLDLNAVLADLKELHRGLLGADIDLRELFADDLARVKVDRGRLEQVVMNLVINARDAMPDGGALTLETANVDLGPDDVDAHVEGGAPGRYVRLTVSDSGTGIDRETLPQLFEPFFTTKDHGTGLGLAVVFGIVKQSGGGITVYSEPGHGATFSIYLPVTDEHAAAREPAPPAGELSGTETILVVEDQEGVRELIEQLLRPQGYTVIATGSPEEALELAELHPREVDLLITDMVMPRMSGREVAERLRTRRPHARVLYVSGYTGNAMVHRGLLDEGARLLTKPFTANDLLGAVRGILDDPTRPVTPAAETEATVTRVVVADDEASVRLLLRTLLDGEPDFHVVGEAETTAGAIVAVDEHRPDLLLLDVGMPGGGGAAVAQRVSRTHPRTAIVALTGAADPASVRELLSAGVHGYLLKGTPTAELLSSLRATSAAKARATAAAEAREGGAAPVDDAPVSVLVVDDDAAVLDARAGVIDRHPALELVGIAQTPFHAVTLAARHQPRVVVLDAQLRIGGGARVAAEIRDVSPDTRIVALAGESDSGSVVGMLRAGVTSYVASEDSDRRLADAVLEAASGGSTMSSAALDVLVHEVLDGGAAPAEALKLEQARRARITSVLGGDTQINIHVQPIADLGTRATVGFEALSRFTGEPARTPDVWFAEAARVGLHVELELLAVRRALALLPRLPAHAWLSVNAGPETLMSEEFARLLLASEPERIVVELTEHAAVADYDALTARVDVLRRGGVRLAVDDCGAGFASLKHVSLLRPDFLKLDVSLCRDLRDRMRSALVRSLIAFGDDIGIHITAEGIETEDDLQALRAIGVQLGQGWHLGRPAPPA